MWPGVVVLDLLMPGISGFDVARSIRKQPWGKHALLISGARKAGFDVNLTKPADPDQIRLLLESRSWRGPDRQGACVDLRAGPQSLAKDTGALRTPEGLFRGGPNARHC